ncbi:unnamed protein product [Choristocarpus tenellus]
MAGKTPFVQQGDIPEAEVLTTPAWTRSTEWFVSEGVRCHAWLYLPTSSNAPADREGNEPSEKKAPPVVILAHGMGAQKDFGLPTYAEAFANRGLASFVFDYRSFGGSDGMPRHLVHPWKHIQDYQSALAHVRSSGLDGRVDTSRLGLWGTSFAGGHVLEVAATDVASQGGDGNLGIKAIVSQVRLLRK